MPISINLLPELGREEFKKKRVLRIVTLLTAGIIILTLAFLGITFGVRLFMQSRNEEVKAEIATQESLIKEKEAVEIKLNEIKQRTAGTTKILNSRKSYANLIENLEKVTPKKIAYSDLTIDYEGQVTLNGTCPSYDELLGFIQALSGEWEELGLPEPESTEKMFSSVSLLSASRDETTYDIRFNLTFATQKGAYYAD